MYSIRTAATRGLTPIEQFARRVGVEECVSPFSTPFYYYYHSAAPPHRLLGTDSWRDNPGGEMAQTLKISPDSSILWVCEKRTTKYFLAGTFTLPNWKKIFLAKSNLCWRGWGLLGDFYHIWWDCRSSAHSRPKFWPQLKTSWGTCSRPPLGFPGWNC